MLSGLLGRSREHSIELQPKARRAVRVTLLVKPQDAIVVFVIQLLFILNLSILRTI